MNFANTEGGLEVSLDEIPEKDLVKILFSENPGILIQVEKCEEVEKILKHAGVAFIKLARPCEERHLLIHKDGADYQFFIDHLRDVWFESSYLLDRKQSGEEAAKARFLNYKGATPAIQFRPVVHRHAGPVWHLGRPPHPQWRESRHHPREKGVNGDREMAYSLYLGRLRRERDVHMTDLISGRETLDDVNMIVYCGGFSNSDVLGSAKGWAGGFLWNEKAKAALDRFYSRPDTLSLGICNGCQLMVELGLLTPDHAEKPNDASHTIRTSSNRSSSDSPSPQNNSVMFGSLSGSKLGIWVAHGEGKFELPYDKERYHIVAQYTYDAYPANPNGSPYAIAGIASADGRHLAMMPHLERAIFPWQCGYYPADRRNDEVTPWIEAFVNARKWGRTTHQITPYIPQSGRASSPSRSVHFNTTITITTTLWEDFLVL